MVALRKQSAITERQLDVLVRGSQRVFVEDGVIVGQTGGHPEIVGQPISAISGGGFHIIVSKNVRRYLVLDFLRREQ